MEDWKTSLFGQLMQHRPDVTVKESNRINLGAGVVALETKYKQPVIIYPFLKYGDWSQNLKGKTVDEGLAYLSGSHTVRDEFMRWSLERVQDGFILARNVNEEKLLLSEIYALEALPEDDPRKVEIVTSEVHGMNHLTKYNKVVIQFSANPSNPEINTLNSVGADMGIKAGLLPMAVIQERYLESLQQVFGRGSIRLPYDHTKQYEPYIVVVPDMESANYVKSCCEDAEIITDYSVETKRKESIDATAIRTNAAKEAKELKKLQKQFEKQQERRRIVIGILTDKQNNVGSMEALLKKWNVSNVSNKTFCKYKGEFKQELEGMGLL
ncbi:hypothetical protein ACB087_00550 [Vibrio sp. VNB-15]